MTQPNPSKSPGNEAFSANLVDPTDAHPIGSANIDDMISVAHDNLGLDPEIDVPSDWIAIQSIAKAVSARIRNDDFASDTNRLSAFLISDRPRSDAERLSAKKEPIVDNGSIAFAGSLWIAGPGFRSAYRRSFPRRTHRIFSKN